MKWHFRPYAPGEKTRDPIQGEFFATEAIRNPAEALIREGIQNSLDAQLKDEDGAITDVLRVRLFLGTGKHALSAKRASRWFDNAWPHFQADGNGLREAPEENDSCPFLVYEDFHTTGLEGDVAQEFDEGERNPFFYFFRAEGRSSKNETDRGRWGVGKYVFPRSSRVSSVFGLTVRADDGKRLLMGTSVLKSHKAGAEHFTPDGYFGEPHKGTNFILPFSDAATLDQFVSDFRISRRKESGLSIVVPWLDEEFTERQLIEAIVRDYFYPILTGGLCVIVETPAGETKIDDTTLEDVVLGLDGEMADELLQLVDLGEWASRQKPQDIVKLKPANPERPEWREDLIPADQLKPLRRKLEQGEKLAIRVLLSVREKAAQGEKQHDTWFNVFLRQSSNESGRPVFVREGIIISDIRGAGTRARGIRSIVIVEHKPAEFAQRALMKSVASGVAFELGDPPFAPVRRGRAVLAARMPMPEAAVDEDDRFVFCQHNVRAGEPG